MSVCMHIHLRECVCVYIYSFLLSAYLSTCLRFNSSMSHSWSSKQRVHGLPMLQKALHNFPFFLGMGGGGEEDESMTIYRGLAHGADASTVRQKVIYGEEEKEIVRQKNGRIQQDLLNVDIVSENVSCILSCSLVLSSLSLLVLSCFCCLLCLVLSCFSCIVLLLLSCLVCLFLSCFSCLGLQPRLSRGMALAGIIFFDQLLSLTPFSNWSSDGFIHDFMLSNSLT